MSVRIDLPAEIDSAVLIAITWVVGLALVNRARTILPWQEQGNAPGAQKERNVAQRQKAQQATERQYFRLGPDSLDVLVLYAIGTAGLVAVVRG